VRQGQSPDRAGNPGGQVSRGGQGPIDRAIGGEVHRRCGPAWGFFPVVDRDRLGTRRGDDHESATSDVPRGRVGYRKRKGGGNGGIDRIAALPEDGGAHFAGEGVGGDHEAVPRRNAAILGGCG